MIFKRWVESDKNKNVIFGAVWVVKEGKEMLYLTTHSTHFIYGYMASDIEETRYHHMGYSFPINSKGSFICTFPQTGLHIPRPLLHQSWSTG